ncbi:hypothetical protein BD779DRAFT_1680432 [Infundibulicybe gibba]|nr:hypothetical protein BD779DRAFT_1680432 [Infundibulicybe gibba]
MGVRRSARGASRTHGVQRWCLCAAHLFGRVSYAACTRRDGAGPAHDAEQAFLNTVFGAGAAHLPYAYNTDIALKHRAPALWAAMRAEMRIVRYTLSKPFADDAGDPALYTLRRNCCA